MKKLLMYLVLGAVVFAAVVYGIYFVLLQQLTFKFLGLNFSNPSQEGEEQGEGFGLPSLSTLAENTVINFIMTNNSGVNFRINNLNLRVEDGAKIPVGNITQVDSVLVPKYGSAEMNLTLKNVAVGKITFAFLTGEMDNYTYVVSGRMAGFLPFRYRGKLNELM